MRVLGYLEWSRSTTLSAILHLSCIALFYTFAVGSALAQDNSPAVLEQRLIESITNEPRDGRVNIRDIRPIGSGQTKGHVCIAGQGSLPEVQSSTDRLGDGVILDLIAPAYPGAVTNKMQGKPGIIMRNGNISYAPNFSAGALWKAIPNLASGRIIDPQNGVAFTPGVRLGGLYEGDGNLMFDYVRVGDKIVLWPGGTKGSVIRFSGDIRVGNYEFIGTQDVEAPLTFLVTEGGFVYVRGNGKVIFPDGHGEKLGLQK